MIKSFNKNDYHYKFNLDTGLMIRYGETKDSDPDYSPYGPEILDLEISTVCDNKCSFCYKNNTSIGKNMDFDTFKTIINKFPKYNNNFFISQVAFGIGSIDGNPDLFKIMKYTRDIGIIPNITINGNNLDIHKARLLSMVCGAAAVSNYDENNCFNAVKLLSEVGIKQTNIHQLLSEETYDKCIDLVLKTKNDDRLKNLNAVVFLMLKPKGRGSTFHPLKNTEKFKELVKLIFDNNLKVGFDSCSAFSFLRCIDELNIGKDYTIPIEYMVESCESDCFSSYINVDGKYMHCSFCEGLDGWDGIDLLKVDNFLNDVWFHPEVNKFRLQSIKNRKNKKNCQLYDLELL